MSLDNIANLAEILSGIAVIVTLIFLVAQMRDNTKALRNNAIDNFYNIYLETTADANRVPDLSIALEKAFTGQPMDASDNRQLCTYIQRTCSVVERGLIMANDGFIEREMFEQIIAPARMVLATPTSRYWYFFLKDKRGLFRPEFHELIENYYIELDRNAALENADQKKPDVDQST